MDASGYVDLYALQDQALETVFEEPLGFYLTGGTALSRYYLHHRYSDDLDFFTHQVSLFPDAIRLLIGKFRKRWPNLDVEVDARDFKRIRIISGRTRLKMDFVSDRVQRIGLPITIGSVNVDTVRNILSNKICAIMGRDEARDIADLLFIARKRSFTWSDIIAEAETKERFQLEELLFRLHTFPVESLRSVLMMQDEPFSLYATLIGTIQSDLGQLGENTLAESGAERIDAALG